MRYVSIFSLPIPKHRDRKMKAILNHFFRECPDAPLTNLYRILEEDILEEDTYYNPKMSGTSRGPGSRKWSNKVPISENVSTSRHVDKDMQNYHPMPMKNEGNSCYINALVQGLFIIEGICKHNPLSSRTEHIGSSQHLPRSHKEIC